MPRKTDTQPAAKRKAARGGGANVFDLIFKQLLHLSNRAVTSFINGLFGTRHPPDSIVQYPGTETVSTTLQQRIRDMMLIVNGVTYHIEAQINYDADMVIRVFEYSFMYSREKRSANAAGSKITGNEIRTIEFPKVRVIYWEGGERIPAKQTLRLKFPDGKHFDYELKTFNLLKHSPADLERKGLAILIPFYVLKLRKRVEAANPGAERQALTGDMRKLLDSLEEAVNNCERKGVIDDQDAIGIQEKLERLYRELFTRYDEFVEEDNRLKEHLDTYFDEREAQVTEKTALKIAKNLLSLGESPEKTAKATGLPLRKVKALLKEPVKTPA